MPVDVTENYIRVRVKDPALFVDGSFKTIDISKDEGIKAVIGKLKSDPEGSTVVQVYLFEKEKWTVAEAEKWVDDHEKDLSDMIEHFGKAIRRSSIFPVIKSVDLQDRSFWAVASTEEVDRAGDVIRTDGWIVDNFKRNPVLLFAHDYSQLPIGKVADLVCDTEKKCVRFKPKFASVEEYPFADQVFKLYAAGYMNAFSVGFNPMEWSDMEGGQGREYLKQELLEISAVPVPCNFSALKDKNMQQLMAKAMCFPQDLGRVPAGKAAVETKPAPIIDPKTVQLVSPISPDQIKMLGDTVIDLRQLLAQLQAVEKQLAQKMVVKMNGANELDKLLAQMRKLAGQG